MSNNMDISVIVPAYNREDYIEKCIKSVLCQENVSTEIIVIDDGSTDRTLEICNDLASVYSNIRVIHQENQGLASARNAGLDIATGDYITFLDSDDCISQGAFEKMLKAIKEQSVDAVIGNFDIVSEDGSVIDESIVPDEYKMCIIDAEKFWELNSIKKCNIQFTVVWAKLFKKAIWEDLRFIDGVRFAEDEYVLPELINRCKYFYLLDYKVYQQTSSLGSLSRSVFDESKLGSPDSKLKTCKCLLDQGMLGYAVEKWSIAVGEIMLMTRLAETSQIKTKVKLLQRESVKLGYRLFGSMDTKKKLKFLGYGIGYPLYSVMYGKQ